MMEPRQIYSMASFSNVNAMGTFGYRELDMWLIQTAMCYNYITNKQFEDSTNNVNYILAYVCIFIVH